MKKFDKKYFRNGWNTTHLMGAGLTNWFLFYILDSSWLVAYIIAPIPTILKEIGDEIAKKYQIDWMFKIGFDRAGFDYRDCIMALSGSILAFIIIFIRSLIVKYIII